MKEEQTKAWGIGSLACGISSLILFIMPYFALPLSIMAIVFSSKQKKIMQTGVGTAGLVTGIIGCVISMVMFIFLFIVFMFANALAGI